MDLPSSTLPAVESRSRSFSSFCRMKVSMSRAGARLQTGGVHQKYPSRFLISMEPSWS